MRCRSECSPGALDSPRGSISRRKSKQKNFTKPDGSITSGGGCITTMQSTDTDTTARTLDSNASVHDTVSSWDPATMIVSMSCSEFLSSPRQCLPMDETTGHASIFVSGDHAFGSRSVFTASDVESTCGMIQSFSSSESHPRTQRSAPVIPRSYPGQLRAHERSCNTSPQASTCLKRTRSADSSDNSDLSGHFQKRQAHAVKSEDNPLSLSCPRPVGNIDKGLLSPALPDESRAPSFANEPEPVDWVLLPPTPPSTQFPELSDMEIACTKPRVDDVMWFSAGTELDGLDQHRLSNEVEQAHQWTHSADVSPETEYQFWPGQELFDGIGSWSNEQSWYG